MSRKGPGASITRGKEFTGAAAGDRGNKAMDVDTVRLLKTQDLGYIRTMRNVAAKEVRALEERFILAGGAEADDEEEGDSDDDDDDFGFPFSSSRKPQKAKKVVFFDGADERQQKLERQADVDGDEEMREEDDEAVTEKEREAQRKAKNLEKIQTKLRNAKKKLKALTDAETELELQQAKMAKTATSGGVTKTGRKIKVRERKR